MANQIVLKKSSQAAKVPLVADIIYGELALNYTDGKLYYKTSSNTIDVFSSNTSTATLTNKTLDAAVFTGTTTINNGSGDEGGELRLSTATTNTTLTAGTVSIDIYQNKIRFFETGGTSRGAYIDLAACIAGAGTNLLQAALPTSMARTFMMMGA